MTRARPSRSESRSRARHINALIIAGATPDEIAADLGITTDALWKLRKRWGHPLSQRRGARRLSVWVADCQVEAVDRLAADLGGDRTKALAGLVAGILNDDAAVARRTWARVRRIISGAGE